MEIGQLVWKIQAVEVLQKQLETKKLNRFVCLHLKISICEFWLILLDHITYITVMPCHKWVIIALGLSTQGLRSGSHRMWDPDPKTTLSPHGLDPDLSCVLQLYAKVREIQFSSAMRVVCVPCGVEARPPWIRIGDPDRVNLVSVCVWRAPLFLHLFKAQYSKVR